MKKNERSGYIYPDEEKQTRKIDATIEIDEYYVIKGIATHDHTSVSYNVAKAIRQYNSRYLYKSGRVSVQTPPAPE